MQNAQHAQQAANALPYMLGYDQCPAIQAHLTQIAIGQTAYEEVVDHAWLNILAHCFGTENFAVEREAFVDPGNSNDRANVSVSHVRNNVLNKVIVVEAKRPTLTEPTTHKWTSVRRQLQRNMLTIRANATTVQTMYGIAAVGTRVRFFYLPINGNELLPDRRDWCPGAAVFDLSANAARIQGILRLKKWTIMNNRNDY
ncbi:hypothetical protein CBS63078_340 [Aspergillus niger]|uniref:Uncharacterized protein n=2 Tax=Aspergillus niger TaxID=5061 RepID=A0A370C0E1_ASPNG|nr:hypothetical protein CBS115989_9376 [Aspergillus niger]RDH21425.1 hypothetical protein M747DRAFT_340798 [Aspergillus niger ATCC 13496]RDK37778.1 hypothetical protein M752DRAFT_297846 [Aspergillus phoenicis ATCC 13157]KAI2833178.1 hypothetical protein CBS133816_543 [Aspergillus niger]KAI2836133.1 hypothetical protein CBS11350_9596 [Aspergillus niger]